MALRDLVEVVEALLSWRRSYRITVEPTSSGTLFYATIVIIIILSSANFSLYLCLIAVILSTLKFKILICSLTLLFITIILSTLLLH